MIEVGHPQSIVNFCKHNQTIETLFFSPNWTKQWASKFFIFLEGWRIKIWLWLFWRYSCVWYNIWFVLHLWESTIIAIMYCLVFFFIGWDHSFIYLAIWDIFRWHGIPTIEKYFHWSRLGEGESNKDGVPKVA